MHCCSADGSRSAARLTAGRGEQFVTHWIVNHGDFSTAFNAYCDRHGEVWQTFDEVGGAIQWIDNPLNILIGTFKFTAFFGDDGVLRVRFADGIDNNRFSGFIDVGYEIIAAFLAGFNRIWRFVVFGNYITALRAARTAMVSIGCIGLSHWMLKNGKIGAEYSSEIGICLSFMIIWPNILQTQNPDIKTMLQNIRIVLVETSHTGNMGSVARAMKTMGLTNLWLVNPLVKPDSQAIALAAGASDVIGNAQIVDTPGRSPGRVQSGGRNQRPLPYTAVADAGSA